MKSVREHFITSKFIFVKYFRIELQLLLLSICFRFGLQSHSAEVHGVDLATARTTSKKTNVIQRKDTKRRKRKKVIVLETGTDFFICFDKKSGCKMARKFKMFSYFLFAVFVR